MKYQTNRNKDGTYSASCRVKGKLYIAEGVSNDAAKHALLEMLNSKRLLWRGRNV